MTEKLYSFSLTGPVMDLTMMRRGEPYATIASEEHAHEIGYILVMWSEYENRFKELRKKIYAASGLNEEKTRRYSHREHVNAVLREMAKLMPDSKPFSMISETLKITQEIGDERNALSHGNYSWSMRVVDDQPVSALFVKAMKQGAMTDFSFTVLELRTRHYQLANASGRLQAFMRPSQNEWLQAAISTTELAALQALFEA